MIERNSESYLNYDLDNVNWNLFDGGIISVLLQKRFELVEHCNLTKLNGFWWEELLRIQPQLSIYCDWDKINVFQWSVLLYFQPQFQPYCFKPTFNLC